MPYGAPSTNPALLAAIRRAPRDLQDELLATTWVESGGNPYGAPGDNGRSWGAYQEYDLGRGAGLSHAQRQDPVGSTQRATREFQQYAAKGLKGGALAAAAQRPADPAGYAKKVDAYLPAAQKILGQAVGYDGSSPATVKAQNESPTGPNGGAGLHQSVALALSQRQPGQSLFHAVLNGVMATAINAPAVSPLQGLKQNPSGAAPQAGGGEPGAVGAAKRWLGTPYSWGGGGTGGPGRGFAQGANTVGFDCSSLMQYAWGKMGVALPRTTYDQIKVGVGIDARNRNAWKPGDLMFPSTGHVQMYVGNGKVIEAPRTGGHVQIVPVRPSYIAVRRPR